MKIIVHVTETEAYDTNGRIANVENKADVEFDMEDTSVSSIIKDITQLLGNKELISNLKDLFRDNSECKCFCKSDRVINDGNIRKTKSEIGYEVNLKCADRFRDMVRAKLIISEHFPQAHLDTVVDLAPIWVTDHKTVVGPLTEFLTDVGAVLINEEDIDSITLDILRAGDESGFIIH